MLALGALAVVLASGKMDKSLPSGTKIVISQSDGSDIFCHQQGNQVSNPQQTFNKLKCEPGLIKQSKFMKREYL